MVCVTMYSDATEGSNFAFAPEHRRVAMASEDGGIGHRGPPADLPMPILFRSQVAWVLNRFAELCGCWNRPETRMTLSARLADTAQSTGRSPVESFIEKAVW